MIICSKKRLERYNGISFQLEMKNEKKKRWEMEIIIPNSSRALKDLWIFKEELTISVFLTFCLYWNWFDQLNISTMTKITITWWTVIPTELTPTDRTSTKNLINEGQRNWTQFTHIHTHIYGSLLISLLAMKAMLI